MSRIYFFSLPFVTLVSAFSIFQNTVGADEKPSNFLEFSTDFAAKCVTRGGVMIYLTNTHKKKAIKVTLHRWFMDRPTADRGKTVLPPSSQPDPLGCSLISDGKQEWKIIKAEWLPQ